MKSLREFFLQTEEDETATKSDTKNKSKTKEGDKPKKAAPKSKKDSPKKEPEKKEPEKKIPSLSQLAKSATDDEKPKSAKVDKPSDDFPDFDDKKDDEPFGNAEFQNDPPKKKEKEPAKKIPSLKSLAKTATSDKPSPDLPTFRKKQKEPNFGHPDFNDPEEVDDDDIFQNVDDDDLEPNIQYKKDKDVDMAAIRKDKQKAKDFAAKQKSAEDDLKKLQNTPKPPPMPNSKVPSLASLAKRDTPQDPKDPLAGFPKFADKDTNAEDPFAQPGAKPTEPKKSFLQKSADILKKAGSAALDKGMAYGGLPNPKKPGMPSQAAMATGKDQAYGSAPGQGAPEKMSLMKSLSQQRFGTDVFKDKTAGWKAGDIVDVGFIKGFKAIQKKPNGWLVSRNGKKYMVIGGMLYPLEH